MCTEKLYGAVRPGPGAMASSMRAGAERSAARRGGRDHLARLAAPAAAARARRVAARGHGAAAHDRALAGGGAAARGARWRTPRAAPPPSARCTPRRAPLHTLACLRHVRWTPQLVHVALAGRELARRPCPERLARMSSV
jgi:hypothetical protein